MNKNKVEGLAVKNNVQIMKHANTKEILHLFTNKITHNKVVKKPKMLAILIFVLLTACGKPAVVSINTVNPSAQLPELPFSQELHDALDDGLEQYGGMGISAAIIVPGYATWLGVSGVSHGTTPITTKTLFSAGSITKMYTAVTILQLAEEGVLSLEDPISKWLPAYPQVDSTITIRQLLNHTGGVFDMVRHPDYWQAMLSDLDKVWQPEQIITNFLLEPYFPKGIDWHYSTPGYILLRMIIKEATGLELSAIYRERLLEPLALNHTFLAGEEKLPENTAHGWFDVDGDGKYDDLPSFTSFYTGIGGGIYASAEDLARWSHALFSEHRLLNEHSYEQMLTFHSPNPGEPLVAGYGLGVVRFSPELFNGLGIWGHSGNAPGFAAGCLYLPDYDVSIGIMVNTEAGEAMVTINDLLNILVEEMHGLGES
jgi:D-alanyl-D-alanine carboxypeptidase